jgi:hypothetical protein
LVQVIGNMMQARAIAPDHGHVMGTPSATQPRSKDIPLADRVLRYGEVQAIPPIPKGGLGIGHAEVHMIDA